MTATYRVRFERRARNQLAAVQTWIAAHADSETAARVVGTLLDRCASLSVFPERGSPRDDIRVGLGTIPHDRRYTIGYRVIGDQVIILGIAGRGQPLGELVN